MAHFKTLFSFKSLYSITMSGNMWVLYKISIYQSFEYQCHERDLWDYK